MDEQGMEKKDSKKASLAKAIVIILIITAVTILLFLLPRILSKKSNGDTDVWKVTAAPTDDPTPEPTIIPTPPLSDGQTIVTDGKLYEKVRQISECVTIVANNDESGSFCMRIRPTAGEPSVQATEFFKTVVDITNSCKDVLLELNCLEFSCTFMPVTNKPVYFSVDCVFNNDEYLITSPELTGLMAMATDEEYNNAIVAAIDKLLNDNGY